MTRLLGLRLFDLLPRVEQLHTWSVLASTGAGEQARDAGWEEAGLTVGVVTTWVRSGWDTEVVHTRLESLDSFLWGNTGWARWV